MLLNKICCSLLLPYSPEQKHVLISIMYWGEILPKTQFYTPGPHLMRIHLVRYSTIARYEKYSIIHLVQPIIHLVRIFALSTS